MYSKRYIIYSIEKFFYNINLTDILKICHIYNDIISSVLECLKALSHFSQLKLHYEKFPF